MDNFTSIPIIDLALAWAPETKRQFLSDLQDALVRVGFFYLKNHGVAEEVERGIMQKSKGFFDLPLDRKLDVDIGQSKSFSGYSRLGSEASEEGVDHCEVFAISADLPPPGAEQPVYFNMHGPCQWPDEKAVPGFREAIEAYRSAVQDLSNKFIILVAEALGLEPTSFARFFGETPSDFTGMTVRNYPPPQTYTNEPICQGIGPHTDTSFMTYVLQQNDHHTCLQVQNKSGTWIPAPPIPGTLVVNIGRVLEFITRGVCTATTHQVVLTPESFVQPDGTSLGPRQSVGFFQEVNYTLKMDDLALNIPPHIADIVKGERVISDAKDLFFGVVDNSLGDRQFTNYLMARPAVSNRWYPGFLDSVLEKRELGITG